jgi:hypothetical protein
MVILFLRHNYVGHFERDDYTSDGDLPMESMVIWELNVALLVVSTTFSCFFFLPYLLAMSTDVMFC